MRALEKSTGKTSGELEKMMEQGQLTAEYIKPLVMAMGELAEANGAYEKALLKLGTVENRLKTTAGLSSAKIAEAGLTKGLINLYETLMDSMNENGATLTRIGKIYEKVFNGIANVVQVVTKWVEVFVRTLDTVWQVMQWGVDNPIKTIVAGMTVLIGMIMRFPALMGAVGKAIVSVLSGPLAIITTILGAIDEVRAVFDENVIGLGENDKASAEDRKIAAVNARVSAGFGSEADKKYLASLSEERVRQAQEQAGGAARYFGYNNANPFKSFGQNLGSGAYDLVQSSKDAFNTGFSQTIIVQGNMTEDNIQQIRTETQKVLEQVGMMNSFGMR